MSSLSIFGNHNLEKTYNLVNAVFLTQHLDQLKCLFECQSEPLTWLLLKFLQLQIRLIYDIYKLKCSTFKVPKLACHLSFLKHYILSFINHDTLIIMFYYYQLNRGFIINQFVIFYNQLTIEKHLSFLYLSKKILENSIKINTNTKFYNSCREKHLKYFCFT